MNINENNYEEWMVAFLDGELSAKEQELFNSFMEKHPVLKEELNAYRDLRFTPNNELVYNHKETLLKKEGGLIILQRVWPFAAILLIALSIYVFVNEKSTKRVEVAEKTEPANEVKQTVDTPKPIDTVQIAKQLEPIPVQEEKPIHKSNRMVKKAVERKVPTSPAPLKKEKDLKPELQIPQEPQQEIVVQQEPQQTIIPEKKKEVKEEAIVKQESTPRAIESKQVTEKNINKEKNILVINKESHPVIHEKLNKVVSKVETKIEKIKELQNAPITVSIGKRRLFTLNH